MSPGASRSTARGDQGVSSKTSCNPCRAQHVKCSEGRPTCDKCRKSGRCCTYEKTRKRSYRESNVNTWRRKADAYDTMVNKKSNLDSRQSNFDSGEDESEDDRSLSNQVSHLSLVEPSSFSDAFFREMNRFYGDETPLESTQSNFYVPDTIPCRRIVIPIQLPDRRMAQRLVEAQHKYLGYIFAFTDPMNQFEQLVDEAYRGPPSPWDREACLRYAKVLVVLALGNLYWVNRCDRGTPGSEYFRCAVGVLPDLYEGGSVLFVETLALVSYFFQNAAQPSQAFIHIGMALTMAKSLRLHQEFDGDMDNASREHRRRVWWSVYSLDRILSIKSGNPITIADDDIGVQLPGPLPGEPDPWPATVLYYYTRLSQILAHIHAAIYRKGGSKVPHKSGKRLMESIGGIMEMLYEWHSEVLEHAGERLFDRARDSITRESVSTFAHYYQCINMTVRPLLSYIVQERLKRIRNGSEARGKECDWKTDLSPRIVEWIELCINGAQEVIAMMSSAHQKDLVATFGYMDGEHIVSATIVLVMVYLAFPSSKDNEDAMHAGLALLYDMGERGNSHIEDRYKRLSSMVQTEGVWAAPDPTESVADELAGVGSNPNTAPRPSHAAAASNAVDAVQGTKDLNYGLHSSHLYHGTINPTSAVLFPGSAQEGDGTDMTGLDYTVLENGFRNPTAEASLYLTQQNEAAFMYNGTEHR